MTITPCPLKRTLSFGSCPTPLIEEEPFDFAKTCHNLFSQIEACQTATRRSEKLDAFQRLATTFFKELQSLETDSFFEKKKASLVLSLTLQEILQQKRIIHHWKNSHLKRTHRITKKNVLQYFSNMKRFFFSLPLFQIMKKRFVLIAHGQGLNGEQSPHALEQAKKAFHEQFDYFFSHRPLEIHEKNFRVILSQKPQWRSIRDFFKTEILKAELLASSLEFRLRGSSIQWLSGSQSSALPLVFQKRVSAKPSLIPTGMLLNHNIAPLCGAFAVGILSARGINHTHLSGTTLANFPIALRYANTGESFRTSEKKALLRSLLLSLEKKSECFHEMIMIRILLLQLLEMDSLDHQEKEEIQARLTASRQNPTQAIDSLVDALTTVSPLPLSALERSFVEQPFPLLFGSMNADTCDDLDLSHFSPIQLCEQKEKSLRGPLPLGEKIQLLFVPEDKVDPVKEYVGSVEGLTVSSINTLHYLYRKHCCFNGICVYPE